MQIKNDISSELKEMNIHIPFISMPEMSLPDTYFESLPDAVLSAIKTEDTVGSFTKLMPFELPADYFATFDIKIREQLHSETFIESLPDHVPFEVPSDYFTNLPAAVIASAKIALLPADMPYSTPLNYFEPLTETILEKTAKAGQLTPLRATRSFYSKMWVAASLFLILGAAFIMITQNGPANVETELAQLSDTEIEAYIKDHAYEFDNHISYQMIDESKIDLNKLENDIYNAYFDDITDEEINNFL
ncbi:MAG: hypothetical protein IT257_11935 [Chitinophagaceae bacterium]|nr:hypothetical protein [Chitinophagaceae bacterium]